MVSFRLEQQRLEKISPELKFKNQFGNSFQIHFNLPLFFCGFTLATAFAFGVAVTAVMVGLTGEGSFTASTFMTFSGISTSAGFATRFLPLPDADVVGEALLVDGVGSGAFSADLAGDAGVAICELNNH